MHRLDEWVLRMSQLLKIKNFEERRRAIKRSCVYGMGNFCSGRANPDMLRRRIARIKNRASILSAEGVRLRRLKRTKEVMKNNRKGVKNHEKLCR